MKAAPANTSIEEAMPVPMSVFMTQAGVLYFCRSSFFRSRGFRSCSQGFQYSQIDL